MAALSGLLAGRAKRDSVDRDALIRARTGRGGEGGKEEPGLKTTTPPANRSMRERHVARRVRARAWQEDWGGEGMGERGGDPTRGG